MIYTLTSDPSLDLIVKLPHFCEAAVNRTEDETVVLGGKGLNVSQVLSTFGVPNIALGFVAGFTGDEIEKRAREKKIRTSFIRLEKGVSRINIKMISNKTETAINARGPVISKKAKQLLQKKLSMLNENDMLVISGNAPASNLFYREILKPIAKKHIPFVVDASGELLKNCISLHPFIIKPNIHELSEIFHRSIKTKKDCIAYAKKLQTAGARNVLLSLGKGGAILVSENNQVYSASAPHCTLANSVGAGDAMLAGFIASFIKTHDAEKSLAVSVCTGTAKAASIDFPSRQKILSLIKKYEGVHYEHY